MNGKKSMTYDYFCKLFSKILNKDKEDIKELFERLQSSSEEDYFFDPFSFSSLLYRIGRRLNVFYTIESKKNLYPLNLLSQEEIRKLLDETKEKCLVQFEPYLDEPLNNFYLYNDGMIYSEFPEHTTILEMSRRKILSVWIIS